MHPGRRLRRLAFGLAACGVLVVVAALAACDGSPGGHADRPTSPDLEDGFHVGYSERVLDLPVGAGLGGYGARYDAVIGVIQGLGAPQPRAPDARPSPFTRLFEPSIGVHTLPRAKAVALSLVAGERREHLVVVNVDAIFVTTFVRDAVIEAVAHETGLDLGHALHLTTSHTHAAATGHYNNVFGAVATDAFNPEIFDRYVRSITDTVVDALAGRTPGRIGAAFFEDFDPDDLVYKDRRVENDAGDLVTNGDPSRADFRTGELLPDGRPDGPMKDRRLAVFRVEDTAGTPLAAIVHFPIHGTSLAPSNLFISTDAPGLIEDKARERVGVPVLHLQGASGDIQPTLDLVPTPLTPTPGISKQFQMMERVAERAARTIGDVYDAIETTGAPTRIRAASTTFRQDRQLLGYDQAGAPFDQFDAPFGALFCGLLSDAFFFLPIDVPPEISSPFQCLSRPSSLNIAFLSDAVAGLIFPLLTDEFDVSSNTDDILADVVTGINPIGGPYDEPSDLFHTRVSYFSIEGVPVTTTPQGRGASLRNLGFFGVPGEATTPWTYETRRKIAIDLDDLTFEDLFVVGYTNDFQSYLVNQEDWLFGGSRELGTNVWGPLWGEYVRDRIRELAAAVQGDLPLPVGPEIERFDPVPYVPPVPLASPRTGLVVGPADTPRFGTVRIEFLGGDPIVDRPHVVVEARGADGMFSPVVLAGGRALDEGGYETMLVYEYDETNPEEPHLWSFHWLITENDPVGEYRLRVDGRNHDGAPARSSLPYYVGEAYGFETPAFRVSASEAIAVENLALGTGRVAVDLAYPIVPDVEGANAPDAFRDVPERPSGVDYEVVVSRAGRTVLRGAGTLGRSGRGELPDALAAGTYDVELVVADAFGNVGSARFADVVVP